MQAQIMVNCENSFRICSLYAARCITRGNSCMYLCVRVSRAVYGAAVD